MASGVTKAATTPAGLAGFAGAKVNSRDQPRSATTPMDHAGASSPLPSDTRFRLAMAAAAEAVDGGGGDARRTLADVGLPLLDLTLTPVGRRSSRDDGQPRFDVHGVWRDCAWLRSSVPSWCTDGAIGRRSWHRDGRSVAGAQAAQTRVRCRGSSASFQPAVGVTMCRRTRPQAPPRSSARPASAAGARRARMERPWSR